MIFLFSLFSVSIIFLFFQLNPQELFICDEYKEYSLMIFNNDINFKYPVSKCDDKVYFAILDNFESIFENTGNQYQNRPLYLLLPLLVFNFLSMFDNLNTLDFIYELSYLISQIIFSTIAISLLVIIANKYFKINNLDIFVITFLYYLNPVIQFGTFSASNGTLSVLVLISTIFALEKYKNSNFPLIIYLIFGCLFLANRSFIVAIVTMFIFNFNKNRLNIKYYLNSGLGIILFFIPNFIYKYFMRLNDFLIYDINAEYYGQFIWISKYFDSGIFYWSSKLLLSEDLFNLRLTKNWNSTDEWYCQNIPDNFICFIQDLYSVSLYLIISIILILMVNLLSSNKFNSNLRNILLISGFINLFFWSFIGWYPPLRFGLFSLGNFIFILLIFTYFKLDRFKFRFSYFATVTFGYLNVAHWNNPNFQEFKFVSYLSFALLILTIFQQYKFEKI